MIRLLKGFSAAVLALAVIIFGFAEVREYVGRDDTMPVMTADSDTIEVPCQYTPEQLLAGVTASDAKDGDLTSQILVGSFTRFINPGVCDLSYVVFDSSENMTTMTRRVRFTDYRSPRFALRKPLVFEENSTTSTDVQALFSASDLLDGDLTDWITYVETDAVYSNPGDYSITMEVGNSFGDLVRYTFPIHVYERNTQNLTINLTNPLVYVDQGSSFDPMAYVSSVCDELEQEYDLALLRADSTVDLSTPGVYEVHYEIGKRSGKGGNGAQPQTDGAESEEAAAPGSWTSGQYGQTWLTVIVQEVTE